MAEERKKGTRSPLVLLERARQRGLTKAPGFDQGTGVLVPLCCRSSEAAPSLAGWSCYCPAALTSIRGPAASGENWGTLPEIWKVKLETKAGGRGLLQVVQRVVGTVLRLEERSCGTQVLERFLFAIQVQFVNIPVKGRTCPGSSRASSGRFPALGSVCGVSSGV